MLALLTAHALAALLAPWLVRSWGRTALSGLAVVPMATFGWALTQWASIRNGTPVVESYPWVPDLGLGITLRMTTLPWLMVLLVSGVGALVLVYSAQYFSSDEAGLGRFAAVFVAFAGAMFGLVISDDLLLLYVFWELTTVFSYLLIGHDPVRQASRRAALQALMVTTLGGLAMLVGLIMLGQHAGSYRLSEVLTAPAPGAAYLAVALVMVLLGALSKSAIFPFSFWLPAAMAAPTPVSAYLHAAAMVKAGVFLMAMLAPSVATDSPWQAVVFTTGLVTMLLGGWAALRQHDLKLLLAYGTVSQLGLLTVALGAGTQVAALAGAAMLLAHALFKSTLFLVVGIIDRVTGTRDLRELSGLGRRLPVLCAVAVAAAASMAGLPPTVGFVAKEGIFEAFTHGGTVDRLVLGGLVAGSVLTVAYTLRFVWGAFATRPGLAATTVQRPGFWLMGPATLLATAGLLAGLAAPGVDRILAGYTAAFTRDGAGYHLALWHGFTPALGLSALVLLAGGGLAYLTVQRPGLAQPRLPVTGAEVYGWCRRWLDRLAVVLTAATQRGSLPFYLGVILTVLVSFGGLVLLWGRPFPTHGPDLYYTMPQLVVGAVGIGAAVFAARAQRRMAAAILVGVSGYAVAALFILHGAPDLALTQFLVETVSIVLFVLVLRRLPARFSERPMRRIRRFRIAVGVAVGLVMAGLTYVAVGGRMAVPVSVDFPELAYLYGSGRNVVNVTLVDIRAWDTMGEISVLVVAATGVASLIFRRSQALTRRRGNRPARGQRDRGWPWLMAGDSPEARRQSIMLQVVARLLFHPIVLFSLYLLFSGHNAPGGGFAGGLVAGLALTLRYLSGGRQELNVAAPADAGVVLGTGLLFAVGTGVSAMLLGGAMLQSAVLDLHLPVVGDVHLVTSVFFDIGVYLIVVGLILDILRSLGAEVDRQQEAGQPSRARTTRVKEKELV